MDDSVRKTKTRPCEWMGGSGEMTQPCTNNALPGKSYCESHHYQAYYEYAKPINQWSDEEEYE